MPAPESQILNAIRQRAKRSAKQLRVGIGDDCAVLRPRAGEELVITTDLSLEGTHFRRDWHSPESIGHRCLARGLSDIAAMGARPVAAFLSIAVPEDVPQPWLDAVFDGLLALADRYACPLAGGDLGGSAHGVIADIMVIGAVPRGKAMLRSQARPGDVIYVTGALGAPAATLRASEKENLVEAAAGDRHFFPEPRIGIGEFVRKRKLARAMIDVSDGLSTDLSHICAESKVGAILNRDMVPIHRSADLELALHGGEDYELLFTASPRANVPVEIGGVAVTEIGWITRERGLYITDLRSKPQKLEPRGWQYFAK